MVCHVFTITINCFTEMGKQYNFSIFFGIMFHFSTKISQTCFAMKKNLKQIK